MKTILVPTDFSKNAKNALIYAIEIAKKMKAKIIVLHVPYDTFIITDAVFISKQILAMDRKAKKGLADLSALVENTGNIKCEMLNIQGFTIEVILETIKKKKVDMIVMGTKGASGIKEVIMGSNTAKVIEKATCPVIAVPSKAVFEGFKKITYATNYILSDFLALKQLVAIASVFKSQINVLHVADLEHHPETEEELMQEFMKMAKKKINYPKITYQLIYNIEIELQLEKYLKEKTTSLLVMSTHYRNIIDKVFGKSITKKLALHSKVPLMVFHYKQEPLVLI
jgi:nucleotide-binding universal stress UspA family protein